MRALLDTAVLVYAAENPGQLSRRALAAVRNPENILELSAVSLAEIAIKSALGKLALSADTVRSAVQELDVRILPFTGEHAYQLFRLPLHHRDPFDRQIITQALFENIAIVTPDEKFQLYAGLKVIW